MDLDEMLRVNTCRAWMKWLSFEPNPDYSEDAGTWLLSQISYKHCYEEFYVGKIPRIRIGGPVLQRGVVFKWFYSLSHQLIFVGGTCTLPSALLVENVFVHRALSTSALYKYVWHRQWQNRKNTNKNKRQLNHRSVITSDEAVCCFFTALVMLNVVFLRPFACFTRTQ